MFWFCLVLSCCVWLCWLCFVWFCRVVFGLFPLIFHRFLSEVFRHVWLQRFVWYSSVWPLDAVSLQTWLCGCGFFWPLSVDQFVFKTQNNKFQDELKHYLIVKYMFFDWKIAIRARISFRFVGLLDWWFALWYFVEILDSFLVIVFCVDLGQSKCNATTWTMKFTVSWFS